MRVAHWIKRYIPTHKDVLQNKYLRIFGGLLHNPNLWHFNRHSVTYAFSVGCFTMLMPIPFQTIAAAALAILFNANLPISIALVWLSNPITSPPLFYFCYKVGAFILNIPSQAFQIELSWEWLSAQLHLIWQPFLLGSFLCAIALAIIVNLLIRLLWRISITIRWRNRKKN